MSIFEEYGAFKALTKADDTSNHCFNYFSEKIRLELSCELSA